MAGAPRGLYCGLKVLLDGLVQQGGEVVAVSGWWPLRERGEANDWQVRTGCWIRH